jgi:hypothetical protein
VNLISTDILFDSGASVSLLRHHVIKNLQLHPVQTCINLRNASGERMSILGQAEIRLSFAGHEVLHSFLVIKNLLYPVIVGVDFLSQQGISLKFSAFDLEVTLGKELTRQSTIDSDLNDSHGQIMSIFLEERKGMYRHGHSVMALSISQMPETEVEEEIAVPLWNDIDFEIPEDIPSQYKKVIDEFRELFVNQPGKSSISSHQIPTIDNIPVRIPPRRIPTAYRVEVHKQIATMLKEGVITPSKSAFSTPCVFVPKKNGEVRICIDYRELNKKTVKDAYPLPLPDEIQEKLRNDSIFSTLDLKSGYWQIPVSVEDQHKTAFCPGHEFGLFEFKRMPFGLCGAPATFQRTMNEVLQDLPFTCVYLDDILIHSKDEATHQQHLREVFQRLKNAQLTIRGSKCCIGRKEVTYLGHVYSHQGMKPDPRKVEAISKWPEPKNSKEIQQFIGLANYYRRFVKNFASIAAPLHKLTQKEVQFVWSPEARIAFNKLKKELCSNCVLQLPKDVKTFVVSTDASNNAVGAVLEQEGQPIAFASRLLRSAETKYSVIEKECLALVFAMKQFRHYLLGRKFQLQTDHKPLVWIKSNIDNPRISRWALALQEYDYEIQYKPGLQNIVADTLSREPVSCVTQRSYHLSMNDLRTSQTSDQLLQRILYMKRGRIEPRKNEFPSFEGKSLSRIWREIIIEDDMLKRVDGANKIPIIGGKLRRDVLKIFHDTPEGGHLGADKTWERCRREIYWPGMYSDIQGYCRNCPVCQQVKMHPIRPTLQSTPIIGKPLSLVGVDVLEVPVSRQGNRYLVVFQDHFTKWAEVYAVKNQTAETIEKCLLDFISRYGPPDRLHSDQGANFESRLLKNTLQYFGIQKSHTTTYHPQSNGLIERMNRTILTLLRSFVTDSSDWEQFLGPVLYAYRSAIHSSTGFSPYEMFFARKPPPLTEDSLSRWGFTAHHWLTSKQNNYKRIVDQAVKHISDAQKIQKRNFDKRASVETLEIGDEVWMKQVRRADKLSPKWLRGWVVKKVLNDQNVVLEREGGQELVTHREKIRKVHGYDRNEQHNELIEVDITDEEAQHHMEDQTVEMLDQGQTEDDESQQENTEEEILLQPELPPTPPPPLKRTRPKRNIQPPQRFIDETF